jgi:hypothetical protein
LHQNQVLELKRKERELKNLVENNQQGQGNNQNSGNNNNQGGQGQGNRQHNNGGQGGNRQGQGGQGNRPQGQGGQEETVLETTRRWKPSRWPRWWIQKGGQTTDLVKELCLLN